MERNRQLGPADHRPWSEADGIRSLICVSGELATIPAASAPLIAITPPHRHRRRTTLTVAPSSPSHRPRPRTATSSHPRAHRPQAGMGEVDDSRPAGPNGATFSHADEVDPREATLGEPGARGSPERAGRPGDDGRVDLQRPCDDHQTTRPRDHETTRPRDHETTRPRDHETTRPRDHEDGTTGMERRRPGPAHVVCADPGRLGAGSAQVGAFGTEPVDLFHGGAEVAQPVVRVLADQSDRPDQRVRA